jgi:hypothetical protein
MDNARPVRPNLRKGRDTFAKPRRPPEIDPEVTASLPRSARTARPCVILS